MIILFLIMVKYTKYKISHLIISVYSSVNYIHIVVQPPISRTIFLLKNETVYTH